MVEELKVKTSACGSCHSNFLLSQLQFSRLLRMYLCPNCKHRARKWADSKNSDRPEIYRRVMLEDLGVGVVGKDVPYGYQDDPAVIEKKMAALKRKREGSTQKDMAWNKEYWGKLSYQMKKNLLKAKGLEYLRRLGWSESMIESIIGKRIEEVMKG